MEAEAEAVKTKTATINTPGGETVALKSDDAMPTKKRSERGQNGGMPRKQRTQQQRFVAAL